MIYLEMNGNRAETQPQKDKKVKKEIALTDFCKIGLIIMDNRKVGSIKVTSQTIGKIKMTIKTIGKIKTIIMTIGKTIKATNNRMIIKITMMTTMAIMMTE